MTSPTGRLAHSSSPASSRSKSAAASGWSPRSSTNERPTRSEGVMPSRSKARPSEKRQMPSVS
jgi:hypothetical protein